MSDELKPCPFCGATAQLWTDGPWHYVECDGCEVGLLSETTQDKAASVWNTRPVEDALRARIAELEALAEHRSQVLKECKRLADAAIDELEAELEQTQNARDEVLDTLDAAMARVAVLEAAQRPIPFSEREPEDNQWVLAGRIGESYWYPIQWPKTHRTHWLPMPPAPEEEV